MPRLLDPAGTVAIIIGAYDWTKAGLVNAPSFRRSAAQLNRYLLTTAPYGLGLEPDLILNLFDDPSPAGAQLVRIRDTVRSLVRENKETERPITDVLIYYVGHGTVDYGGHLHLLVKDSSEGIEEQSSIAAPDLAQVLRVAAPQQRRLVVLDCCFSEAAATSFGGMGTLNEAVAATALRDLEPGVPSPERGTLLLCSSPRGRVSIGAPNAELTLFTGTMLSVLREGSALHQEEMLSFSDLRDDIYDRMLREYEGDAPRPALHQPDQQAGDLTRIPAFPNLASALHRTEKKLHVAEVRTAEETQSVNARATVSAIEAAPLLAALPTAGSPATAEAPVEDPRATAPVEPRRGQCVPLAFGLVVALALAGTASWWAFPGQPAEMARREAVTSDKARVEEQAPQAEAAEKARQEQLAAAKSKQAEIDRQVAEAKAQQEEQASQAAAAEKARQEQQAAAKAQQEEQASQAAAAEKARQEQQAAAKAQQEEQASQAAAAEKVRQEQQAAAKAQQEQTAKLFNGIWSWYPHDCKRYSVWTVEKNWIKIRNWTGNYGVEKITIILSDRIYTETIQSSLERIGSRFEYTIPNNNGFTAKVLNSGEILKFHKC